MLRRVLSLVLLLALVAPAMRAAQPPADAPAEPVAGVEHWKGAIALPGLELTFTVHFTMDDAAPGGWAATLDIPMQGVAGAMMKDVVYTDKELAFTFAVPGNPIFRAAIDEGGRTASGTLTQAGQTFPLTLTKQTDEEAAANTLNRPQNPQPPFPYEAREVTFRNEIDGIDIAGTLTIPNGAGPFPAVVMITGSGPQDRDESLMGHRPFWVIADHLTRHGIAVLRCDDRGVGGTGGNVMQSTSENFALDALAGVAHLRTIDRINGGKIGLMGHSEGGIVAPLAAVQSRDVAFIILLAGTGLPGHDILRLQTRLLVASAGAFTDEQLDEMMARHTALTQAIMNDAPRAEQLEAMRALMRTQMGEAPEAAMDDRTLTQAAMQQLAQMRTPWFRSFLTHDPRPALRKVTCPVLALNGSLDLQVPADANLDEIGKALAEAGNADVTTTKLDGLNHLFQHAITGSPAEYMTIEETFAPEVLDLITKWIQQRFGGTAGGEAIPSQAQ